DADGRWSLPPRQVVTLWEWTGLVVDGAARLDTRPREHLSDHLRYQHHADVLAEAFMTAKAEMEVVIPIALGHELVGVRERLRIEHRRLRDGQDERAGADGRRARGALADCVIAR